MTPDQGTSRWDISEEGRTEVWSGWSIIRFETKGKFPLPPWGRRKFFFLVFPSCSLSPLSSSFFPFPLLNTCPYKKWVAPGIETRALWSNPIGPSLHYSELGEPVSVPRGYLGGSHEAGKPYYGRVQIPAANDFYYPAFGFRGQTEKCFPWLGGYRRGPPLVFARQGVTRAPKLLRSARVLTDESGHQWFPRKNPRLTRWWKYLATPKRKSPAPLWEAKPDFLFGGKFPWACPNPGTPTISALRVTTC